MKNKHQLSSSVQTSPLNHSSSSSGGGGGGGGAFLWKRKSAVHTSNQICAL
jgi:hypothetical protein